MSNERDELAEVVCEALEKGPGIYDTSWDQDCAMADTILAAGYRKPRTVTTMEELEALVGGTIIRTVKSAHNPYGLCLEKYGKEWLALDPGDKEDGETLVASGTIVHWYGQHSITVIYEPAQ